MESVKRCWACDTIKPVADFCRDTHRFDGLRPRCRRCESAASADYRRRHNARVVARERAFATNNPERLRAKARRFYERHTEKERTRRAAYSKANPEKVRQWSAKRRALQRRTQVGPVNYLGIKRRDGMRCHWCHRRVSEKNLHFDHVIPLARGGAHVEDNIVVSHARCNRAKKATIVSLF